MYGTNFTTLGEKRDLISNSKYITEYTTILRKSFGELPVK